MGVVGGKVKDDETEWLWRVYKRVDRATPLLGKAMVNVPIVRLDQSQHFARLVSKPRGQYRLAVQCQSNQFQLKMMLRDR